MIDFLTRWHHEMVDADRYIPLGCVLGIIAGLALIDAGRSPS